MGDYKERIHGQAGPLKGQFFIRGILLLLLHILLDLKRSMRFILLVLIFFCSGIYAQEKLSVGIYGSEQTGVSDRDVSDRDPVLFRGHSVGVRANFPLRKNILQAAVLFSRMDMGSVSYYDHAANTSPKIRIQSDWIESQFILKHRFRQNRKISPFIGAGLAPMVRTRLINYGSGNPSLQSTYDIAGSGCNLAIPAVMGLCCRLDDSFSFDLETIFRYFAFKNTNYRHQLSVGLGLALHYRLCAKTTELAE
jgi:hypothetical protein